MIPKFLLTLGMIMVLAGALALGGCFAESPYGPAYTPAEYPAYGPYGVYSYGDYDHYGRWHDSRWWVDHDRDWVEQHHPEWLETRRFQNNDRFGERAEHGGEEEDHDRR